MDFLGCAAIISFIPRFIMEGANIHLKRWWLQQAVMDVLRMQWRFCWFLTPFAAFKRYYLLKMCINIHSVSAASCTLKQHRVHSWVWPDLKKLVCLSPTGILIWKREPKQCSLVHAIHRHSSTGWWIYFNKWKLLPEGIGGGRWGEARGEWWRAKQIRTQLPYHLVNHREFSRGQESKAKGIVLLYLFRWERMGIMLTSCM